MKRFIALMGIAIMAFAACSKDVIKETKPGSPIKFRTFVDNTKAQEVTNYNMEYFHASAITISTDNDVAELDDFFFKDVQFTRIGDYFYSYPTYYWPEDNRAFAFIGHYPSMEAIGATSRLYIEKTHNPDNTERAELKWEINDFAPAQQIKDQVDLITGFTLGNIESSQSNDGVKMFLDHALSQIAMRACSSSSTYTYKICGVRIAVPRSKADMRISSFPATFYFTYKTNEITVYEDTYDTPITLENWYQNIMNPESGNAILLPQPLTAWNPESDPTNQAQGAYISVKLQITDKNGNQVFPESGEYGWAATPLGGQWIAGNRYNYTLDFTNGAGFIDPTEATNPGKNVLGDKILLTSNLGAWNDKVTVEATNSDLIGHWIGLKGNYIDSDDQIEHKYETAEEVEEWLGEFYDFVVPDDHTLKIKNAAGEYNTPTTFNVVNNEVLMDCFRVGDTYQLKPYIQYIDETSAIIVNTYVYTNYTRVQTIYYKKNPLE
jgi:hypothetical protein